MKRIFALFFAVLLAVLFAAIPAYAASPSGQASVAVLGGTPGEDDNSDDDRDVDDPDTNIPLPVSTPTDSIQVTALSSGNWTAHGRAGHATASGDTVSFRGHPMDPFVTLLFRAATDGDYRTFTFHLSEGLSDWHTVEGSGFVFNASITGGSLSGNALLFTSSEVGFYQLTNVSLSALNGTHFTALSGVTLVQSMPKPSFSSGSTWYLKLRVSPGSLSFEKYTNPQFTGTPEKLFDNIPITSSSSASGYGPFASFISHDCEVISTSSFDYFNITISPNTPPAVSADDVVLNRGDSFSPMSGVTASDSEDGDLTGKVTVTANNVNNQVPGIYNVTYSVSDILGLTASHTRKVTVLADVEFLVVDKGTQAPLSGIGIRLNADSSGAAPVVPDTNASGKADVIVTPGRYSYEIVKGHPDYIIVPGAVSLTVDSSASSVWPMPVKIELIKKVYDVGISLDVSNENAYMYGDTAVYRLTVTNHGNIAVVPTVSLTADAHIETATTARADSGAVTLGAALEPGKSETVELPYKIISLHADTASALKAAVSGLKLKDGASVADGNPANDNAEAEIRIKNPPVILHKIDAGNGNRLSSAQIKIENEDGKTVFTGSSDRDGQLTVHGLLPGSYTVTEVKPPAGYVLAKTGWTFRRAPDGSVSGTTKFPNDPTRLLVTNISGDTKERLNGGVFVLLDKDGKVAFKRTIQEKGEEPLANIPPGTYTLKQVQPPVGYMLSKDEHAITVSDLGEVTGISEIVNDPVVVTITKTDSDKHPVEGSAVVVINAKQEKVGESVTDKDGKVVFTKLAPGKYTYRETKAPAGYVLNKDEYAFEVKEDGSVVGDLAFINRVVEVTILKLGPEKEPVAGASIEVYDALGKKVHEGVTGTDGMLILKGVPQGKYTYREVKAPSTYALNPATYSFFVDEEGKAAGELEFTNEYVRIDIKKVDLSGKPLAGAKFGLFDSSDKQLQAAVSGADGILAFTKLPVGVFQIRELEAPEGYVISGKAVRVEITETYENAREPIAVENSPAPQTGVDGFPWWGVLILVFCVLGLAGTGIFLWMKYKKA